jgi:hypothetical protein
MTCPVFALSGKALLYDLTSLTGTGKEMKSRMIRVKIMTEMVSAMRKYIHLPCKKKINNNKVVPVN